jgi:hypothetical protein
MPPEILEAFNEVHAAVEVLNRDLHAAITEQAFERSAELRERADILKGRKEKILDEWQQMRGGKRAEAGAGVDRPRE